MQLLDFLMARGRLDAVHRERVQALRRERGESESVIITRLGMLGERDMAESLAEFLKIPLACPSDYPAARCGPPGLTAEFIARAQVLPLKETGEGLVLAMADPTDDYTLKAVRLAAGGAILPWAAVPSELKTAFGRLYGHDPLGRSAATATEAARDDVRRLADFASEEPAIRYVNGLIARAAGQRASDIHIEASADRIVQRMRVDGLLREIEPPPPGLHDNIVSRLKVMAGLNIAEKRLPQDGRFRVVVEGREIDLRISIVPTLHGESVVMRLLDRARAPLDLAELGYNPALRAQLETLLALPSGMLLVTGPTGSGKTSTLYAALQLLNSHERKILTIEDPVEYELPGVNQIPVRPAIGLTFASMLRSLLRQDPDIMLVGEIRDLETAHIAAQASLTGHLLLSTVHTNDAIGTIVRLTDMGLEDYLVAAVLKGIVAQRLVRCLCPDCRSPYTAAEGATLYRATGCENCAGTGYRGRTAIAELLMFDDVLARLIVSRAGAVELRKAALDGGMIDLRSDGLAKVTAGITSMDEVLRVIGPA
jgi:general secretion pathway protein E